MRSVVNTKIQPSGKIEKWGLGSRNRWLQTLLRRPAAPPSPSPSLLLVIGLAILVDPKLYIIKREAVFIGERIAS